MRQREEGSTRVAGGQSSVRDLEQRINAMRHEVERRVKAPGADLKAAPFRAAANVKTLAAYTEVVIVIVTPHWYGVETPDGPRGWVPPGPLETLPLKDLDVNSQLHPFPQQLLPDPSHTS